MRMCLLLVITHIFSRLICCYSLSDMPLSPHYHKRESRLGEGFGQGLRAQQSVQVHIPNNGHDTARAGARSDVPVTLHSMHADIRQDVGPTPPIPNSGASPAPRHATRLFGVHPVETFILVPGGRFLLTNGDSEIILWDLGYNSKEFMKPCPLSSNSVVGDLCALAPTSDGKELLVAVETRSEIRPSCLYSAVKHSVSTERIWRYTRYALRPPTHTLPGSVASSVWLSISLKWTTCEATL